MPERRRSVDQDRFYAAEKCQKDPVQGNGKRQCEKVLYQRKDPDGSLFVYRVISEMKGNYQQRHQRSGSLSGKGTSRCDQCSDRTSFGKKDQIQDIGSADPCRLLRKLYDCRNRGFPGIIIAVNAGMNGTERNTDSCYAKKTEVCGVFRIAEAKICVLKKQKTGCSRKKTAISVPVTSEKRASFFS